MSSQTEEELKLLIKFSRLLFSKLDASELIPAVISIASTLAKAERASLYLLDEKKNELYFHTAMGLPPQFQSMRFKIGEGIAGTCASQMKSIITNNIAADARHSKKVDNSSGYVTKSMLTSPVIYDGKLKGVLQALNRRDGSFTETDQIFFESFATHVGIAINNTQRYSLLEVEHKKINIVLDSVKEATVVTDGTGRVTFLNNAGRNFFSQNGGFERITDIERSFTCDRPISGILKSPDVYCSFELTREEPKQLYLRGKLIKLKIPQNDDYEKLLWIFSDITEIKLEQMIGRSFASMISHKFRTPLTAITGYAGMLENEAKKGTCPPIIAKSAEVITRQSKVLNGLMNSVLDMLAVDSYGRDDLVKKSFPVRELIDTAARSAKQNCSDCAGAEIEIISEDGLTLNADRNMIETALKALLDNAIKFNPNQVKKIGVNTRKLDGRVLISVRDNGSGIPSEDFDRIVNRFYQIEEHFTGQIAGLGLGLKLVNKILSLHNGSLIIESAGKNGSTFTMSLPG